MPDGTKEVFASTAVRYEEVDVPGVGKYNVRGLTAKQIVEMTAYGTANGDIPILIFAVIDKHGAPLFTKEDLPMLCDRPFEVISPLLQAAKRLSFVDAASPKQPAASS